MSDASVSAALRSTDRLVVIEAPAGCGKTFQGAQYARDTAATIVDGRVLILAHTHAACDTFACRIRGSERRVDIRTIDGLISQIAAAYHPALRLPADTGAWAQSRKNGYAELAVMVTDLLRRAPMIARSLAQRYPIVICDEHQDATNDQHTIAMALHAGGASIRIFGDPMQRIFGSAKNIEIEADGQRWEHLKQAAGKFDKLDHPHRWSNGSDPLGLWILEARRELCEGRSIDLRARLPPGVSYIVAENESPKHGGYRLAKGADNIYARTKGADSILVLTAHNRTAEALRAFFGRQLAIWEGHVRDNLLALVTEIEKHQGDAAGITTAVIDFLGGVATGFSNSAYGNILRAEVASGCVSKRSGKPASLQALGRMLLQQPNHHGVAHVLRRLSELIASDNAFEAVKIDYYREFWDAVRLGQFSDPVEGLAEITRRRTHAHPSPPARAISTIHKAKGLECSDVVIMPCDAEHFGESPASRCRLYVAMSRAKRSVTFVVSRTHPSPLLRL